MELLISQIAQAAARGLGPSTDRLQRSVAGAVVISILTTVAFLSLCATGWFAVYERHGPVAASATMALTAAALALVAWAVVTILNRRAKRLWEAERRLAAASAARSSGILAMAELPGLIKASPVVTMLSVAGIVYALMKARR